MQVRQVVSRAGSSNWRQRASAMKLAEDPVEICVNSKEEIPALVMRFQVCVVARTIDCRLRLQVRN